MAFFLRRRAMSGFTTRSSSACGLRRHVYMPLRVRAAHPLASNGSCCATPATPATSRWLPTVYAGAPWHPGLSARRQAPDQGGRGCQPLAPPGRKPQTIQSAQRVPRFPLDSLRYDHDKHHEFYELVYIYIYIYIFCAQGLAATSPPRQRWSSFSPVVHPPACHYRPARGRGASSARVTKGPGRLPGTQVTAYPRARRASVEKRRAPLQYRKHYRFRYCCKYHDKHHEQTP